MLYQFRVPRTRDWEKYLKKLQKYLESNEETSHLYPYFVKAQETRAILVKLLDECAKDTTRPDDIIKVLNDYFPILEQLIEGIEANNVKLIGYLDIVWTSFLTSNVNGKSLSNSLKWEKICCYCLYALAHYQKAAELHHLNRQMSHKTQQKVKNAKDADFDPIFDEVPDVSHQSPQIFDDQERVKDISKYLKSAAAIWTFTGTLFPVLIVEQGKNSYDLIPESFQCVMNSLADLALSNAQEFMIQLAVQTNKNPALVAKLSEGVASKLKQCHKALTNNLAKTVYQSITNDFALYFRIRGDLYHAIALKYQGKVLKANEKHGECVAFYQTAMSALRKATNKLPDNKKGAPTQTLIVIKKSIEKQKQSVLTMLKSAESENNGVYFEVVPKSDQIEQPDSLFAIKTDAYQPQWQDL